MEARFAGIGELALAGKLDSWADSDSGCLALILLLDQFTRQHFSRHALRFLRKL